MSDAQYEQFRRDGGVSDVSFDVDILNYGIDADEELLIENYSGEPEDLSDRVIEVALEQWDDALETRGDALEYFDDKLVAGHWVTIADGEIVEEGEFHPFRVHVQTH